MERLLVRLRNLSNEKSFCFEVADNKSNRAEFIRIPQDASVMKVKELLNRQWCREVRIILAKENRFFYF